MNNEFRYGNITIPFLNKESANRIVFPEELRKKFMNQLLKNKHFPSAFNVYNFVVCSIFSEIIKVYVRDKMNKSERFTRDDS